MKAAKVHYLDKWGIACGVLGLILKVTRNMDLVTCLNCRRTLAMRRGRCKWHVAE